MDSYIIRKNNVIRVPFQTRHKRYVAEYDPISDAFTYRPVNVPGQGPKKLEDLFE